MYRNFEIVRFRLEASTDVKYDEFIVHSFNTLVKESIRPVTKRNDLQLYTKPVAHTLKTDTMWEEKLTIINFFTDVN